ncbi:hypothetical protein N7476_000221 [Penicillium atrosanguineum]|uniref:Nucleoside phosphorylase domain-containing protein n=1 Tax=Penicillium atrosanguineum TaxID=1132637 RepID=A0A9W9UBX7_9EURO|nr:hypothetical protein N7476_000221 [Penicillium atrosanguineum]
MSCSVVSSRAVGLSDPANYVVGWICALATEYVAAQEFLDEEHEGPTFVSPNDSNDYTLGKMGEHNVVIAVLPDREYGTDTAATVATNMLNSFPNVRIGLMVGIGGGVPSTKHDVRLGDVVVSARRDGEGGVFQYDFGKSTQGQGFQHTRFLNQPPTSLRTAMTGIQAQYSRKGHQLEEAVNRILDKNARLRRGYERPQSGTDRLFKALVVHDSRGCAAYCAEDSSNLVPRNERTEYEDNPAIHYGLIASANQLMRDALMRDSLAAEKDVICFEMEAAGLMNHFPCLVIRGICDYSDSHKNKEWQGYASMVAAAYAKDLLSRIPPNRIESEKKIGDILSVGLQEVTKIAQKQLKIQENAAKQKLSDKEEDCLQLFRLTSSTHDSTYEWYKNRVESRVQGTCEWFLSHDNFRQWLRQDSGPLLVSADPGCGKSVLAKYLIDDGLPRSATMCYFFFKDQDQNTVRQALCALLHQLFSQKSFLIEHAMKEFTKDGRGLINSTKSLWSILAKAVCDPQAGPIIIILDALDECAESEFEDLIQNIESQFRSEHPLQSQLRSGQPLQRNFKYLLTSRPYEQIVCKFVALLESFPCVHIPGEEESETISQEVNHVIRYRVEQLAKEKQLSGLVKNHLSTRLLKISHRTYLWVHLVFELLNTTSFKKTPKGVDSTMEYLPKTIYEAYERILKNSKNDPEVRKALSIILAASRPLTLSEMNIALNVNSTSKCIEDLDLEKDREFGSRLRALCGLFISIHHDKVFFLHQTAREFLLAKATSATAVTSEPSWQHSIISQSAHNILAEVCVIYLDFINNHTNLTHSRHESHQKLEILPFLNYSALNWGIHYHKACIAVGTHLVPIALRLCSPDSKSWSAWFTLYWKSKHNAPPEKFTSLAISSYFGLESVVIVLLEGTDLKSNNRTSGESALTWAARNGHERVVELLLGKGTNFDGLTNKKLGQTLLSWAVKNEYETIVRLLLEKGADFESTDNKSYTPLSWAAKRGHEAIVRLLLEKGANFELTDNKSYTPLSWAAKGGHEVIVRLLLEKGANFESRDNDNHTPLSWAVENGYETIVTLLLEKGADIDSTHNWGCTPLSIAAREGHEIIVTLLLEKGADFELAENRYYTPLSMAARGGHETIARLLLEKGANFELTDKVFGHTPLSWAAQRGYETIVKLLLEKGAEFKLADKLSGHTPLTWAAQRGHETIVRLLLEKGADIESTHNSGYTPLSIAAREGHKTIVTLLLEKGAEFELTDRFFGQTPLSWAAKNGHDATVRLLLEKGADFESTDNNGHTPLP